MTRSPESSIKVSPWPDYSEDELRAALDVLRTGRVNYWTGDQGVSFEQEFADYTGVKHGVAVANGSLALGIAIRALDLPPGAEVIVTPRTFIASVNEIILAGAVPVFADVDLDSQNISPETVAEVMTERTAALVAVHLAGWPCDMPGLVSLCRSKGVSIIEDCAQAHGAAIDGRKVGSWGDIAAFSFCQDKIMSTAGEGGMVVTDSEDLWQRCWSFKDHGKAPALRSDASAPTASFKWVHDELGTNCRMTEIQAAIGRIQLKDLDRSVERRRQNAAKLAERLSDCPAIRLPLPGANIKHAYYKFYFFIKPECLQAGWTRDRILPELREAGVPCGSGICPEVYREKALVVNGHGLRDFLPTARLLGETSAMLPVHPSILSAQLDRIADEVLRVMDLALK